MVRNVIIFIIHGSAHTGKPAKCHMALFHISGVGQGARLPSFTPVLTLPQKPAAHFWDEKLDMIQEAGAETLRRIEAKLKVPGKIVDCCL